ncbi:hypothetical protein Q5H93_19950 [Hymenobacter sp. ASUV-10]|uniref:Uncharacterized protein n=1 Tax=Hymenobacter aranciens TaxID=3063996 RepID=A0ABT9BGW6_9BACT|nr:hypothetical protein [Hymenobacter sp. ASUV-10]MDO7877030.1 hypothetical protein [Hymenobacter sp. ASUV-10]
MDERDKDLPLVVSEILIEMHDMKSALNRMAEIMLLQQQETNKRFDMLMEADRANTTMLINAFREEGLATRSRLDSIENRLERLENR